MANVYYYPDHEFSDFFWVRTNYENMLKRHANQEEIIAIDPLQGTTFLVLNFLIGPGDIKKKTMPSWADIYRGHWLNFMQRRTRVVKPSLGKPNPALPILQRLSGFDEAKIREIIFFE